MKRKVVRDDFWDLRKLDLGTVVYDVIIESFRLIIMRGPAGWCSYIGVPFESPLAELPYESDLVSGFECHGGLTFAAPGDDLRPEGWYYFGWDYGHGGDWTVYSDEMRRDPTDRRNIGGSLSRAGRKWTFGEVKYDIEEGFLRMKEIERLAFQACVSVSMRKTKRIFNKKRLIRVNGAE